MTHLFKLDSLAKLTLGTTAALALMACGGGEKPSNGTSAAAIVNGQVARGEVKDGRSAFEVEGDYAIGPADAPVVITEYASVVCGHCANWHKTVYSEFKEKYVDTGKVRYVFRPFPTAPQEMADAGHMIAMCADRDDFFKNIKLQFDRQTQIFDMAKKGQAREAYVNLSKASGLSEDDFLACMQNEEIRETYTNVVQGGIDAGVASTPSFLVNGKIVKNTPSGKQFYTLESIEEVILPLLGEPVPEAKPEDESAAE